MTTDTERRLIKAEVGSYPLRLALGKVACDAVLFAGTPADLLAEMARTDPRFDRERWTANLLTRFLRRNPNSFWPLRVVVDLWQGRRWIIIKVLVPWVRITNETTTKGGRRG